ncbi:MAG: DNA-binding transcriptional regulator Fis [Gammaproteobacteria bacterium]|nr:MAG: DNA-binding transcriptional regulator Fis [Gammaproteobacteria bacterium]
MTSQTVVPLNTKADQRAQPRALRECVAEAIQAYFDNLEGQPAHDVYNMVLAEVEAPLLKAVMQHTNGNQTQASELLGLNRGTLRKKLKQYGLL